MLAKPERKEAAFRPFEALMFATVAVAACVGVYAPAVGAISI